ncbi:MAG: DUF2975 domain-containing protein [Flavobacterium sp.]
MKLKLLTISLIIVYTLTLSFHFKDFTRGFIEGNKNYKDNKNYVTLVVNKPITNHYTLTSKDGKSISPTIKEVKETIDIEIPLSESSFEGLLLGLLGIISLLILPILIVSVFKLFKNMYKGVIVEKNQINRLKFIAYAHLPLAVIGNFIVLYQNYNEQRYATLYNLDIIKYEYDFSLFFIPLILLMIVEVLKQHLKLKEEADLII